MINIDTRALEALNPNEMWLMLHIVKRINADRTAFPSKRTLLKDTGWKSEKTINAAMAGLIEKDMLQSISRVREDGSQTSNLYKITTDYFGVHVPGSQLQHDMVENASPRVQKMQGGEMQKIRGGGGKKSTPGGMQKMTPHEVLDRSKVLSNEVLNNEHFSFSNEKEPVGKVAAEFQKNGEPDPVKVPLTETPPEFRATPPKDKAPNQVYTLYEAYAKFCEAKGIPMSRNANGNFEMSGKDAKAISTWIKWAKGMPGAGDPLNDWQAYLDAAWQHGDKFIKANFTPTILQTKSLSIVYAVNKHRIAQKELQDAIMQGSGIEDLLNP